MNIRVVIVIRTVYLNGIIFALVTEFSRTLEKCHVLKSWTDCHVLNNGTIYCGMTHLKEIFCTIFGHLPGVNGCLT